MGEILKDIMNVYIYIYICMGTVGVKTWRQKIYLIYL